MKKLFLLITLVTGTIGSAQVFNFYGTEYYLSPDSTSIPGTTLTASGMNLSTFNYSTADPHHPLFDTGIFFPVQDCGNRNLWVRIQHIAADPNGTENGFNITSTLNSPFLPTGSTDRIGGWFGFLYDIRIYADQNLTGTRANLLNGLFPTNITVESLETLYNDGGALYEWLSFEILNPETSGWSLNSINFTGINQFSNPGFSSELNYSTTATSSTPPPGFSIDFPTNSSSVYAIDLNLSGAQHSEFRMSASNVSHFHYGYEFTSGGYQGMSMAFGGAPIINSIVQDALCADTQNGSIKLDVTGTEPLDYSWSNGAESSSLNDIPAGDYTVTITDPAGCISTQTYTVSEPEPLTVAITYGEDEFGGPYLLAQIGGGTPPYLAEWSNGINNDVIFLTGFGLFTVNVTDANGCIQSADFNYVGLNVITPNEFSIYPNPVGDVINVNSQQKIMQVEILNAMGQLVKKYTYTGNPLPVADLNPGLYFYRFSVNNMSKSGSFIKE